MSKTIAVVGKGGAGKTTVAVNLAAAMHELGENVLLVDANGESPHCALHLGDGIHTHTIHDVAAGKIAYTHAVHYHPSGLKHVPGNPLGNGVINPELLKFFKRSADVVIYDAPAGKADAVLQAADQVLVVTSPHVPSLLDAKMHLVRARAQGKTIAGIVLNGHEGKAMDDLQVDTFLEQSTIKLPRDERVRQALADQNPYVYDYPLRKGALALRELAARITNRPL